MVSYRKYVRNIRRLFDHKAVVLMYHRVAHVAADPWELAVQPEHFEQHLAVLKKNFRVVPVTELVQQLHQQKLRTNCVCITFDDGYSDNFIHAKPLLEKYQCPASFFIASRYINQQQMFWWDELQQILLETSVLPSVFSLTIGGENLTVDLQNDAVLNDEKKQQQQRWVAPANPPNRRCELFLLVWERLRPLPDTALQQTLVRIRQWAGTLHQTSQLDWPMNSVQLSRLASHPLFSIGLHTVSHTALAFQPPEVQYEEITTNRHSLTTICNQPRNILTYPYGAYNDTTIDVVQKEKLDAAFTTDKRLVTKRSNIFRLGRFQVRNWNGQQFEKQLHEWIKTN